jgi:pseudouridine-5'-phosphate glycosidase
VWSTHLTASSLKKKTQIIMWRRRSSTLAKRITLGEEVKEALYGARKPIVALESTIIAHGMPYPQNFQMATHVEDLIRQQGACPATICIAHGHLKVGLSQKELKHLAEMGPHVKKCSTRDIPVAIAEKIVGATTVSSTMYVISTSTLFSSIMIDWINHRRIAHATGIQVFVTGGIGGVHRFSEETMGM